MHFNTVSPTFSVEQVWEYVIPRSASITLGKYPTRHQFPLFASIFIVVGLDLESVFGCYSFVKTTASLPCILRSKLWSRCCEVYVVHKLILSFFPLPMCSMLRRSPDAIAERGSIGQQARLTASCHNNPLPKDSHKRAYCFLGIYYWLARPTSLQ